MCGEYNPNSPHCTNVEGSPPRVRGIPVGDASPGLFGGITPACAGNTAPPPPCAVPWWDHPRVCGEYPYDADLLGEAEGSPPRVRGIQKSLVAGELRHGITPACAGNTRTSEPGLRGCWDHPRVCGEYLELTERGRSAMGSPPRVRGIRTRVLHPARRTGITPACAGNTLKSLIEPDAKMI